LFFLYLRTWSGSSTTPKCLWRQEHCEGHCIITVERGTNLKKIIIKVSLMCHSFVFQSCSL